MDFSLTSQGSENVVVSPIAHCAGESLKHNIINFFLNIFHPDLFVNSIIA